MVPPDPAAYVIAEVGVNHNGDVGLAHQLIDAAVDSGANAVKFQTFTADALVDPDAAKAAYQEERTGVSGTQHEMLRNLELPNEAYAELKAHCVDRATDFLSTPFDLRSLDFLVELGVPRIKIGSGDVTFGALLLAAARTDLPIILSTGMSTLDEIGHAIDVISFGLGNPTGVPQDLFAGDAPNRKAGPELTDRVTLLHCTTMYPTPLGAVNLRAMATLRTQFGLPVGYSDHTLGIEAAIAAVAAGATIVEKHLTLDRSFPGPDHAASLEPVGFTSMVEGIRRVEQALGSPDKKPTDGELQNRAVARRRLVAARDISAGETFTVDNLTARRPADGISPMRLFDLVGKVATRPYSEGDPIQPGDDGP